MITTQYFKKLEALNKELARTFQKLQKARTSKKRNLIETAELQYFQSVQKLYQGIEQAVNNKA